MPKKKNEINKGRDYSICHEEEDVKDEIQLVSIDENKDELMCQVSSEVLPKINEYIKNNALCIGEYLNYIDMMDFIEYISYL